VAARYGVRVWLALVTVYVVWGSTFIALAIVIRDLPPFLAMSVRHLVAGGVLLAVALRAAIGPGIASAVRRSLPRSSSAACSS
jgi:drug/metabolite transporter (DMT)-like permease